MSKYLDDLVALERKMFKPYIFEKPMTEPKKRRIMIWWRKDHKSRWYIHRVLFKVADLVGHTISEGDKFTEVEVEEPRDDTHSK